MKKTKITQTNLLKKEDDPIPQDKNNERIDMIKEKALNMLSEMISEIQDSINHNGKDYCKSILSVLETLEVFKDSYDNIISKMPLEVAIELKAYIEKRERGEVK